MCGLPHITRHINTASDMLTCPLHAVLNRTTSK